MMKVKTSELTGAALDWAVAKCEDNGGVWCVSDGDVVPFTPSTDWAQGGPIIERELIDIQAKFVDGNKWYWRATTVNEKDAEYWSDGPTMLIATMRCYVASELGDEVEIPEELVQ